MHAPAALPRTIGPYVVERELGRGATGVVFLGRDPRLDRPVALKVITDGLAEHAELRERFLREARTLAELDHPNVATVHGVETSDGREVLVMELVDGESLRARLTGGAMPVDEALEVCAGIADGLEAAHELGVVHRDLKPANVVLTAKGRPKLLDFGLAARVERPASGSPTPTNGSDPLTVSGVALGSPGYMAPEQVRGRVVDRRADLFAFGCLLYECLCGARAFGGDSAADAIAALLESEPARDRLPARTPTRVRELVDRCLAKDPAARQRDAGDAALDLRTALAELRSGTRPAAATQPRVNRAAALAVAAALALVGVFVGTRLRAGAAPELDRVLRFDIDLEGASLGTNDRMMNELAVSPDGSSIAYMSELDEDVGFFLHDLATGTARPLDLGRQPRGVTFSPDGSQLAFVGALRNVCVTAVDGGAVRRIGPIAGDVNGSAAWVSDGRIVIATAGGTRLVSYPADGASEPVLVARRGDGLLGFENLAAVPGESWFLADAWTGDTVDDYVVVAVDPDTGVVERLIDHASSPAIVDGRYLVFQRSASLFAAPIDLAARRLTGEPTLLVPGVSTDHWGGSAQFAVAGDGTLVYAPGKRRGEGRRLVRTRLDGTTEALGVAEDAFVDGVHVAPDGTRVLALTIRHAREMWSIDLEHGAWTPLDATSECYAPVLSADGASVFYNSVDDGMASLRRAPIDGGPSVEVLEDRVTPRCVTPDGETLLLDRLVFDGPLPHMDVVALDLRSEKPVTVPLFGGAANDFAATLSHDGRWIAYVSDRSGRPAVYVRRYGGSAATERLVVDGSWEPRWSPSDLTLYYLCESTLFAVTAEERDDALSFGEPQEVVSDLSLVEEEVYAVAPDGSVVHVDLAPWEREGQRLRVVVGWGTEIEGALASGVE